MVEIVLGLEGDGGAGAGEEREWRRSPDMLVTFLRYYSRSSKMIILVMRFIVKLIFERPKA